MYKIFQGGTQVGTAEVTRQGLYYCVKCKCVPLDNGVHRILLSDGQHIEDLGICIPSGTCYILQASVPAKLFAANHFCFFVVEHCQNKKNLVIEIKNGKEFHYLDRLNKARLKTFGKLYCALIYLSQDRLDSDRNLELLHKSG